MKFCKWVIEKNNNFIELNRTSFLILWHWGAIWYVYNGYFKNIVSYLFLAGCILIFLFKIGNLTQINKVINFLKNSPLNIVIGSLGTGKTAFLVYASKLLKKKKYHIASTFPLLETQKLSLGHMGLLDFDYSVLPDKTLLLWDETNLFLEGTDWEKNNTKNEETGIQEYFALARHFGHIVLASGQRDKHIWVKVRDIANNVIVGIRKKTGLSKILCLDNSFWIILKRRRTENDKKIKKEPDAIDKVVDYFLENIDNPQDLFKGNTIFQEFTKKLTERMLNTEIKDHLETDENHNKRNGNTQKTIITKNGSIAIDVPRDRNSTFEPVIIPKRQRRFDNFDQKVISLYARGMTISDIKAQLQEFYHGAEISESLISQITDDVIEEVKMWQTKPLEKIYPIVYFDCIVVKVKQDKRIINKAVYLALGINLDGLKDILGMWISENEGAKFWLNNLTEMKNRGLQDILVACSDNLTGMFDAIEAVFPKTQHQLCIVHQIRNSLKFVPYKDRKLVANDLKSIYTAINEEIALVALDHFSEKWNKKYPQITKSWKNNWNNFLILSKTLDKIKKNHQLDNFKRLLCKITIFTLTFLYIKM